MMMTYSFNGGSFDARIDFLPEISGIKIFRGLSKVAEVNSNRPLRTTFVLIIEITIIVIVLAADVSENKMKEEVTVEVIVIE